VIDERVRIARELHDVLAHHVSVMGVQAGAARRMLDRAPDRATAPLAAIEESARSAVLELQRMLSFLRRDDEALEPFDRAPQPGLGQVARLVDDVRHAGVGVDLHTDGDLDTLPDTVHLSAYRIVQEALTNVLKHAGAPVHATVAIVRGDAAVTVEVVDDGRGPGFADQVGGTGSGLVGMRERVLLHGGEFTAGPRQGGGFHVRARLPVAERRTAPVASP
jgi:signal transduction histidine kinase